MSSSFGCSILRAEGFFCNLNVLYRGQFLVIKTPGSGSVFSKKCCIRIRIKWIRIRNPGINPSTQFIRLTVSLDLPVNMWTSIFKSLGQDLLKTLSTAIFGNPFFVRPPSNIQIHGEMNKRREKLFPFCLSLPTKRRTGTVKHSEAYFSKDECVKDQPDNPHLSFMR